MTYYDIIYGINTYLYSYILLYIVIQLHIRRQGGEAGRQGTWQPALINIHMIMIKINININMIMIMIIIIAIMILLILAMIIMIVMIIAAGQADTQRLPMADEAGNNIFSLSLSIYTYMYVYIYIYIYHKWLRGADHYIFWQRDFSGTPVNLLVCSQTCQGTPFPPRR